MDEISWIYFVFNNTFICSDVFYHSKKTVSKEKKRAVIEEQTSIENNVHLANTFQRKRQKVYPSTCISEPVSFTGVMNELFVGSQGNAFVDDVGNIKPISYGLVAVQLNDCITTGK